MSELMFCKKCEKYTLKNICDNCNNKTIKKKPPKYSPQDNYGKYRRKLKKEELR